MKYISKKEQDLFKRLWKEFLETETGYLPYLIPTDHKGTNDTGLCIFITDYEHENITSFTTLEAAFGFVEGLRCSKYK
jgi:hypothetical protein